MKHTRKRDKDSISYHYNVSNDFYKLFLDKEMIYSCAYFRNGDEDIDKAQQDKLDLICKKLRLKPGDNFLDIGSGWGALILHAARNYGVKALGVTISKNQCEFARARIEKEGLAGSCRVELMDYRDIPGRAAFDKIASVGMFEHVGIKNLPAYFEKVSGLIKDDGLFLNHGITSASKAEWGGPGSRFINEFVFPDGELTHISRIQKMTDDAGFEIHDLESLRPHYAKTLAHWTRRLLKNKPRALELVDEKKYRIWVIYMAACSFGFEKGSIGVYQLLAAKKKSGFSHLPLTREDIYASRD